MRKQPILLDFAQADVVQELLSRIGIESDFGVFMYNHLQAVLQLQYNNLAIESIQLVRFGDCFGNGIEASEPGRVLVRELLLPCYVRAVVRVEHDRYQLDLRVTIKSRLLGDVCELQSDMLIEGQTFLAADEGRKRSREP